MKTPPTRERRLFVVDELRVSPAGSTKRTITGHAAVFNKDSEEMWGMVERVAPGAFSESIGADDIRALFNHNPDIVLGRNKAGTLRLSEDATGLAVEIDPPDTQAARDLVTSIERGDISQMSFGFTTITDTWATVEEQTVRTLIKCRLYDVSPVTFPAYPDTDVGVRSMEDVAAEGKQRLADAARAAVPPTVPASVLGKKLLTLT